MSERGTGTGDRGSVFELAIDRAVREMLDIEPPAGLRGRVLQRIDHHGASGFSRKHQFGRKHQFSRKILWLGAPLAAAAIIVLALLLPRRVEQVQPQTTVVTNTPERTPAPMPAPRPSPAPSPNRSTASASSSSGLPPAPRTAAPPRPAPADRTVAAASLEPSDLTRRIQPLEAIAPIEVAALSEKRLEPAAITIDPLNPIAEVQIAPLFSSARRN